MQQLSFEKDIHLRVPTPNNTQSVNPVPVDYMDFTIAPPCTDYVYKGTKDEAGALYSPKPDIQIPSWAKFFGFNRRVKYLSFETLAQDEYDWKFTLQSGQINLSTQINWKNAGGAYQWDPNDPPSWANTGFNVSKIILPGYNDFMARCSTDFKTWSLDKLACNDIQFIPSNLPRVPLKTNTGWTVGMAHNQEQAEITNVPAYTIKRYIKTEVIFSDGPIPLIWFS